MNYIHMLYGSTSDSTYLNIMQCWHFAHYSKAASEGITQWWTVIILQPKFIILLL